MTETKIAVERLTFRHLTPECKRSSFSCGHKEIDDWFKGKKPEAHHNAFRSRVTTAHLSDNPAASAFYSIRVISEPDKFLNSTNVFRSWFSHGSFPALQLEWLAVHRSLQRQGIGTVAMGQVIATFKASVETLGIPALVCAAIDDRAAEFYQTLGFVDYGPKDGHRRMLLPAQAALSLPPP